MNPIFMLRLLVFRYVPYCSCPGDNFRGRAPSGRHFSFILFPSGGYGAFVDMDGRAAPPGPSNMIGIPVEIWEENTGISVVRKEIRPDSGGAGKFQGGAGQIIALRNDTGAVVDLRGRE
jgi:N-methylhydantoinase B/oxoprolinase/acetone carboxylase alpha subunit